MLFGVFCTYAIIFLFIDPEYFYSTPDQPWRDVHHAVIATMCFGMAISFGFIYLLEECRIMLKQQDEIIRRYVNAYDKTKSLRSKYGFPNH